MYKALRTFSGLIAMVEGENREIADKEVVKDLIRAGYIVEIKPEKPAKTKAEK